MNTIEPRELANTEVELELIKMIGVSKDIRLVIDNILDAQDLDKRVHKQLIRSFSIELEAILESIQLFPINTQTRSSFRLEDKITEAQEEDEHSQSTIKSGVHLYGGRQERQSFEPSELYEMNKELTQQNDFLTKKLEQAEDYIKKIEQQYSFLEDKLSYGQRFSLKQNKLQMRKETNDYFEQKQDLYETLLKQNIQLKEQLQQSKQFIVKNNEDFVRQIQKYNEKIWRFEKEIQQGRKNLIIAQDKLEEYEMVISRLKQENFSLEMVTRNFRSMMNTDRAMRESNLKTEVFDGKLGQTSRLKNFFKKEIEQSFKRKQTK